MAELVLRDPKESQRGPKRAALFTAAGGAYRHAFTKATSSPYGPSSYDRESSETRKTLAVLVTEEISEFFMALDVWAKGYVALHSKRLLGQKLSEEQVAGVYVSCLKKRADCPDLARLKINMAEPRVCRFWNKAREPTPPPGSWEDLRVKMQVHLSHLWIMGSGAQVECGLMCVVEHAMVLPQVCECPAMLVDDDDESPE